MIIEQAFVALPELLLGNHFAVQQFEAGIVGVLSMAILQELNGRNVAHPIQHLQAERRYSTGSPRRVDLYINLKRLMITNKRLENYGWRHHNWIEAKFYRNKSSVQRHATNKAAFQGLLIADLIRLTCLVPAPSGGRDTNGRYFVHVYDDEPRFYLPYQERPWVQAIHQAGRQDVVIDDLAAESGTAKAKFGEGLQEMRMQAKFTNFVNYPIAYDVEGPRYWCVLTRIDAFSVRLENRWFQIHANRVASQSESNAYAYIRGAVTERLGATEIGDA